MLYEFAKFHHDKTEIVISEPRQNEEKQIYVNVQFERWNSKHNDFDSMECNVPNGKMFNICGYNSKEVTFYYDLVTAIQQDIIDTAYEYQRGER